MHCEMYCEKMLFFSVITEPTKVMTTLCDKCLVKMGMTSHLWVEDRHENFLCQEANSSQLSTASDMDWGAWNLLPVDKREATALSGMNSGWHRHRACTQKALLREGLQEPFLLNQLLRVDIWGWKQACSPVQLWAVCQHTSQRIRILRINYGLPQWLGVSLVNWSILCWGVVVPSIQFLSL